MESRIYSAIKRRDSFKCIEVFGRSSKGLSGLNLIGLGNYGATLREKILYISNSHNIHTPLKKYTICVENFHNSKEDDLRYIDLAILVLYWQLSEVVKINQLSKCFCLGKLSVSGIVELPIIEDKFYERNHNWKTVLGKEETQRCLTIDIQEMLNNVAAFKWIMT